MAETGKQPRWAERLKTFSKALERLTAVIALSKQRRLNEFERDSLIKRFEFTHEMAWKLMMSFEKENAVIGMLGSKDVIRHAVAMGLIDNGEAWMYMIDARNQTSHIYDEDIATDIADNIINTFHPLLQELQNKMKQIECTD